MAAVTVKPFAIAANGNVYILDVLPNATVKRFAVAGSAYSLDILTNITKKQFVIAGSAFTLDALEEAGGGPGISTVDLEETLEFYVDDSYTEDEIEQVLETASLTDAVDVIEYGYQQTHNAQLTDAVDTKGSEYLAGGSDIASFSDVVDAFKQITVDLTESLQFSDVVDSLGEYFSDIEDSLGIVLEDETEGVDGLETWVMNTATGGISQYRWKRFTDFAQNNRSIYGIDPDGVYLIGEDDDDDGQDINAYITLGKTSFGTFQKMRMFAAYVNLAASGDMRFKVYADDQTYKYEIVLTASYTNTQALEMARAIIGKGLRATNWIFEIQNVDGADFEIESVKVLPVVLDRRVR